MGIYDSYYQGIYSSQRPSVYQQQYVAWLLQQQLERLKAQSVSNLASQAMVPVNRPGRLRNERFEVVESRVIKLGVATARRVARENRVHGSPRASPSGTLRYEYGVLEKKYGSIEALDRVRRHFESLGYKTNIPHGSPRASVEGTIKYIKELERVKAPKVSVDELSKYLEPVPATGTRIPHSTTLNPDISDKRLTTIMDKYVETPSRALENNVIKPLEAWVRERARQQEHIQGVAGAVALSGLKFLQGAYEGATSIIRPWSIADSVASAVRMGPSRIIGYYTSKPLEISRLIGGFVGGYLVGKSFGKLYSGIKARLGKPDYSGEFEFVPKSFEKLRTTTFGKQGYLVRRITYIEKGVAKPVYSLGREQGLIGEYSIRMMKSGDYTVLIGEGYRLPGKALFKTPIKTGEAIKLPEKVFGTGYRVYGFEKPGSPIIYGFEKILYRNKPVSMSRSVLTNIIVYENKPGYLTRFAYWIGRKLGLTKKIPRTSYIYTGRAASESISYVIDLRSPRAGGVSISSLIQEYVKPRIRVKVPVIINRSFGELTSVIGIFTSIPKHSVPIKSKPQLGHNIVSNTKLFTKINNWVKGFEAFRISYSLKNISNLSDFIRSFDEASAKSLARSGAKHVARQVMLRNTDLIYGRTKAISARSRAVKPLRSLFIIPRSIRSKHKRKAGRRRVKYFERFNPFNL